MALHSFSTVRAAALLCLPLVAAAYSTMPACAGSSVRRCLATRSSPIRCADLGDEPQPLVLIATDAEVAEWDSEYEALDEWLEREEEARMMLVRLGSTTTSAEEKATIVDTLLAADASERDALLDVAISLIDRSERQRLARRRLRVLDWIGPLGRIIAPRRRIIGRYRRLLDDLESREPGSGSRFSGEASARRRRFLVLLLRQARGAGSIADVEREALRSRSRASMAEMLARTPAGLETPTYEVISSHASWEVREYDEFAVCTTAAGRVVSADPGQLKLNAPKMPAAGAFQALAGYIFGKNKKEEKMAMTTPVLSFARDAGEGDAGAMRMAFVLPSKYWAEGETPPSPVDGSVSLESRGGGMLKEGSSIAVLWFDGFAGKAEQAVREAELLAAVESDDEWELVPDAQTLTMQYNDPFTPPWKRRNEVAVAVRKAAD